MRILLAASEAVPYCKTGGLADVVGALARQLGERGHDVRLFLPLYRGIKVPAGPAEELVVPVGGETLSVRLRTAPGAGFTVCFLDYPPYFDRPGLYGEDGADYGDNDRRFILLARGTLEGCKRMGFSPEVAHLHDWQAGLLAAYLKRGYAEDGVFARTAVVMTVHNMAYQGNFPASALESAGLGLADFTLERLEFYGKLSFMKAGLVFADLLTTVSPTYAREIQESERGFGFEGLLRSRAADLHGVINGIDPAIWDPARDPHLARSYSAKAFLRGKAACKADLRKRCGLEMRPDLPLFGIVSRMDRQKGLDLALAAIKSRLDRLQLVVLGAGDPEINRAYAALARENPGRVYLHDGFDEPFAHRVYAGSDLFLMPSRFEPCGLGQMIAMRYGSLPIASHTGGLADTVREFPEESANGFLARPDDPADLALAMDRALAAFANPQAWRRKVSNAMASDFSWDRSVSRYLELYGLARERLA